MPTTNPTGEQLAKLIDVRIQEKFDTLANWEKNNPVLLRGEMGFAALDINNGMDVGNIRVKIGDGTHTWNELGWGALGPTGVNIHMTKEPVEVDADTNEGTVVYDSIISGPAEVKIGDFVIDHITTKSDNMYKAGWDGSIGFYRIKQVDDAVKAAVVEPWGDPMIVKGQSGATGPTGANPAMAIKLQNTDYIRSYNLDTKCGWFYGAPGNTVGDKPSGVDSFTLCVYRKGDNQYIHELYDQNNRIWIETYNGTQWTEWKEKAVGIGSVTGSFSFTNTGNSGENTGTINITLDDYSNTPTELQYTVRNGIGISNVEIVKPSPVQTTGSAGNTYNLKVHKSEGGKTDDLYFTVFNGNGIAGLKAVKDSGSSADSGSSEYHLEYKDTDNKDSWTEIEGSAFTVHNGQGLVRLEVTGTPVTSDSGSTEWTINAYYSDNPDTAKNIGTFTTYNGQGLVEMRVGGTANTDDSGTSTYTVYATYSDKLKEEVSIGTFQVQNGKGIKSFSITGPTSNGGSNAKNTYTYNLTDTDDQTHTGTIYTWNGAQGNVGPTGPTGAVGPTGPSGSTPANAKQIPSGTDLNTYTYDKAGWYYASGGNNCVNKPANTDAFGLEVLRNAAGWTVQICYPSNNSTNKMFIRNSNNGTWTAWQEKGINGTNGTNGINGYTWIPSVDASGNISWTSAQSGPGNKPSTQNIKGPRGYYGYTFIPNVDANGNISWTKEYITANDDPSVVTRNIKGLKGDTGSNGYTWIPSVNSANGKLSWTVTQQGSGTAPAPVNLMGPTGPAIVPALDASGNLSWTIQKQVDSAPATQSILGPTGPVGPTGPTGATGPTGPTGPQGQEAYTISFDSSSGILTMTKV